MESVGKLEATVASWYKSAPHLPAEGRKWIAQNAWWLVALSVLIGILGVISTIGLTFFAGSIFIGFGGPVGAVIGSFAIIAVVISLFLAIICLAVASVAILPLKAMQKKGWVLLFLLTLFQVVSIAISFVLTFDLFGTIWALLWVAVGTYFLFEVREYFIDKSPAKKPIEAKVVTKKSS